MQQTAEQPATDSYVVRVDDYKHPQGWVDVADKYERARHYCEQIEAGRVVYFEKSPFDLPEADRQFLLAQRQSDFKGHKNVSYRPNQDMLRGAAASDPAQGKRLQEIMRHFSHENTRFLSEFLAPYADKWKIDFASFRPLQEQGRALSLHKRNDLVHVDSFPSRPTNGGQILRVFTNINSSEPRVWNITDPFPVIARKYADDAGLPRFAAAASSPGRALRRLVAPAFRPLGVRTIDRSPYDQFMLRFHDWLKESRDYQDNYPKVRIEFPPGATWMVFTDVVPHAVLSGQFMLEQTYIIPPGAQVTPDKSPIRVLEAMCGKALSN